MTDQAFDTGRIPEHLQSTCFRAPRGDFLASGPAAAKLVLGLRCIIFPLSIDEVGLTNTLRVRK